jgi:hypothetical protein
MSFSKHFANYNHRGVAIKVLLLSRHPGGGSQKFAAAIQQTPDLIYKNIARYYL